MTVALHHGHVELALHELAGGSGRALLLLHGLGERTPSTRPAWTEQWPGPVYGLDFTGHGESTVTRGGGYTAELWTADADVALSELGDGIVLVGAGVSAYVALLLAGARPQSVSEIMPPML